MEGNVGCAVSRYVSTSHNNRTEQCDGLSSRMWEVIQWAKARKRERQREKTRVDGKEKNQFGIKKVLGKGMGHSCHCLDYANHFPWAVCSPAHVAFILLLRFTQITCGTAVKYILRVRISVRWKVLARPATHRPLCHWKALKGSRPEF